MDKIKLSRNPIFAELHTENIHRLVRTKLKLKNYKSYEQG